MRARWGWLVIGAVAACDRCGSESKGDAGSKADVSTIADANVETSVDANVETRIDASVDASVDANDAGDAGASACRLIHGPTEQPFRGPAAMVVTPSELRLVANDAGKPRVFTVPIPPASVIVGEGPKPASFVAMRWSPCEVAGKWAYCQAQGGSVYRTTLGTTDTKQIAKSAPSTRIAAAALGSDHAVLATLDARHTTEGVMLQAFATLDDGETVRLSEDGAGATTIRLVSRGDKVVALYLDTRTAMVPVHARTLGLGAKGELARLDDAVVFVGGPPERGIDFAAAQSAKSLVLLLPSSQETTAFGMAAIPIADPPKDDTPAIWSSYPNGLDPAPIGASVDPRGAALPYVARVRPREAAPGSPRVVELGRVDEAGAFSSLGPISAGKHVTDVAVAVDTHGAVWILYGDASATWLERRLCP
ncbi:MAG: hypothetical protein KF819_25275 [Labilithrix sp.]|nr:hypothetical protein [Labilithrix sp.]